MNYNNLKEFFKNKINFIGFFIALICAYMIIPNYFELNVMPLQPTKELWLSLDPSWSIALNYIKKQNLIWGQDIAFTYGPLAHFCTRVGWGENKFTFFFFDLFIFINYFFLFFISFKNSINKILTTLIILAVCVISPIWIGASNALVLMIFLIFWVRLSLDKPKILYYAFQIVIVTLLFFIKFNTGLIVLPFFYLGIICNLFYKKGNRKRLITYSILPILLIIITSFYLKVSLFDYVKSGLQMIAGYNDVMFLANQIPNSIYYALLIAIILTLLILINVYSSENKKWFKILTILFLFGSSIFVIYKQAFVRADVGHIREFFLFIPLLILCNFDLYKNLKKGFLKIALLIVLIIPFYFIFVNQNMNLEIKSKFSKEQYISRFNSFNDTSGLFIYTDNIKLPDSILEKVGSKTIDVYPWNIQLLLENKLNYLPRPVIQSYTAYTPYLENLNFNHYNSIKAPDYLIYDFASIDGRYPLFDESKVNLALLKNYELEEYFDYDKRKIALLKKKVDFKKIKFEKINEYAMLLNSPLVPKEDIYYEIGVYNNILGKFVSIFEHAPEIRLEIKTNTGNIAEYRTSKFLLESGFFYDKFISNTKDLNAVFNNEKELQKVDYYKIKPLNSTLFKEKLRITEFKIIQ